MTKMRKRAAMTFALAVASVASTAAVSAQEPTAVQPAAIPAGDTAQAAPAGAFVHPGPLADARKVLLNRIQQAKAEGVGTANYNMAHTAIEDMVKSGATEEQIKPRVLSLANALRDQENKSKILKTQRPLPPTASQQGGSSGPAAGGGGPAAPGSLKEAIGGGNSDDILARLKEKLGTGDIQIPEHLKEKVLNSEKGKKILEKLGGL